ncbi:glutamate synthase-related protein [Vulcanisaeta distributa]|uniref:Ferredoxin-dependent glutamate synthase n=1 Tax=Vulcanisaeta distributa (strain DSM 14429 / JCM 11212 / NBRC 100878 / IC-017) TaxID=572478 RepID=E1QTP2_VULDI|nr:glutamate synthase-related protein [Vulcanisaeta distributa]ADN49757.1 ferredoxin-dependent glutamate synthase [Vulcanisaeta distributa DSM 14429]
MILEIAKLLVRLRAYWASIRGLREFIDDYPFDEIALKALKGRDAVYPFGEIATYGSAVLGSGVYDKRGFPRFKTLDNSIILLPPAFTPKRLEKMAELLREPTFMDVNLEGSLGGFKVSMPIVVGSMGSTSIASKFSLEIARAAAKAGIVMGIGENVATVRGYSRRYTRGHPSFKERLMAYLTNVDKYGGVVIQQNVEDAYDELWNKVYSDKDVEPYIEEGLIGFEIKMGQGAKPGLGGVIKIPREEAIRLKAKYHFEIDPEKVKDKFITRYSVPGTYTEDILRGMIRFMKTAYPRARIWIKLGPYRDVDRVISIAHEEGAHAVVIDGKEGGTGMAPSVAMKDLGYPTIVALKKIHDARKLGIMDTSLLLAGRLYNGSHVVKAVALGASGAYMARPFLIAAMVKGEKGVLNYIEAVKEEMQMLVSALGKYDIREVNTEDVAAIDRGIAEMFGIPYVYSPSF